MSAQVDTVLEVAANGDTHTFVDLGPLLGAIASNDAATAAAIDATHLEMWRGGDSLVIDATGYQAIADLDPIADLGPLAPGIGVVDLAALGATGDADLVAAIVGSTTADPVQLAQLLPTLLDGVIGDPSDPSKYTVMASYADLLAAMGGNLGTTARGAAEPIAKAFSLDVDQVVAFYVQFFQATPGEGDVHDRR